MKFAVLDVQGYFNTDFQVKELAIYDGEELKSWLFKPKILNRELTKAQKREVNYVFHNLHGIPYNAGYVDYGQVKQLLYNNLKDVHIVYVKGYIKKEFIIRSYREMNQDPPKIVNLEFSNALAPKLDCSFTDCKNHRISICSCSIKNVYVLYDYLINLLPQ